MNKVSWYLRGGPETFTVEELFLACLEQPYTEAKVNDLIEAVVLCEGIKRFRK